MTECLSLQNNAPELLPVSRINDYIPYPTKHAVRKYITYNTNGFKDRVARCIGKRQYILTSELYKWIKDSNCCRIA